MIKVKIEIPQENRDTDIRFPITERELYNALGKDADLEDRFDPPCAMITEIYWPEEFSILKGRCVNLDEMNCLGKRMESFDALEMDQFLIGISKLEEPTVKSLINLTFNLNHFTLCKDVSHFGKIGRAYILNTTGAVRIEDEDDPKYVAIGKDLIDRGLAQITERGLLIYDEDRRLSEIYDGSAFPPYYDRSDFLVGVMLKCHGKQELLLLPEEEIAIRKAVARLGASSLQGCSVDMDASPWGDDKTTDRITSLIEREGICAVNTMLQGLDSENINWQKFLAAVELTDLQTTSGIAALAERLDEFAFIPKVSNEEKLGQSLVLYGDQYSLSPELEEFFDFAAFGQRFAEEYGGQFTNGGYAYYCGFGSLDELMEEIRVAEDEGLTMGDLQM